MSVNKIKTSLRIKKFVACIQIPFLYASYYFFKLFNLKKNENSWVIGVDEVAGFIYHLKKILNNSTSVSLSKNKFYNFNYDYSINLNNKYLSYLLRLIYAPILLGYLTNKNSHFWYIWSSGFLMDRDYEFSFLKSKKIKIICHFCGNDIRSITLTNQYAKQNNIDMHTYYYPLEHKYLMSHAYEINKIKLAENADKYADVIFNYKFCQISHLKSKQYSCPFIYDLEKFNMNDHKFANLDTIKILHAPSSLLFKGTPLVRAAIKKLELENYKINYVELQNVPNQLVLEHLKSSHIVLNQFYALTPGYFGVEAMANHCAVLMSADPGIEIGLPENINDAWLITRYWEIYDNLKYLLLNKDKIKYYADNGYKFTLKNYSAESAGKLIDSILRNNLII